MKKKKTRRRRMLLIFGSLGMILLLAAGYAVMAFYFRDHYYWGTTINGVDCSCMTREEALDILQADTEQHVYTIKGPEGVIETIPAQDIEIVHSMDEDLDAVAERQKGYLWFQALWNEYEYHIQEDRQYDKDKLKELIEELECFDESTRIHPQDAYISEYLPEIKGYQIVEEVQGNILSDEAKRLIEQAAAEQRYYVDLDMESLYERPERTSEDEVLNALVDKLNHYTQTVVTYRFGDETEILDGDRIHEWLTVQDDEVVLDQNQVAAYVSGLAAAHDTYYNNKRFVTTAGIERTLFSRYGFLMDVERETQALLELLETGGEYSRTPLYNRKGANYSHNNIGDDYVEIDMTMQHLYLYVGGSCILESDIVSGCMSNGCTTPEGIYDVDYKTRDTVLRGPTWEDFVYFWMPFNSNIGMHDATWRDAFGGDIYLNDGSHGCINLPLESAQVIYDHVYAGMPVICYY